MQACFFFFFFFFAHAPARARECVPFLMIFLFFLFIVSNHVYSTDMIFSILFNSIPFCCDNWTDMHFCFNVNCPYLYSHLCVYILYNVCVCFKTPCKHVSL